MQIKYRNSDFQIVSALICPIGSAPQIHAEDGFSVAEIEPSDDVFKEPQRYVFEDGKAKRANFYRLLIITDAGDNDGDGTVDIKADGQSSATITVQKQDEFGLDVDGDDEVWVATTRGSLSKIYGRLRDGKMELSLTSVAETVVASVTAKAKSNFVRDGATQVQFRP